MFADQNLASTVTTFAVLALIIALVAIVAFVAKRIRRVPPNEALIIVGRGAGKAAAADGGQRVVVGGRVFVWPILQQGFPISLEQRQIGITVEGAAAAAWAGALAGPRRDGPVLLIITGSNI